MPIYVYQKEDGTTIEKLFSVNNYPNEIILQNGEIAKKIVTPCMFGHVVHNEKQEDLKKRQAQQRIHMMDYNVEFFNPLKGQSSQQAKKDFQVIKNKLSQEMLQKKEIRKKNQKQKKEKKKKTFKQNEKLYYKMKEDQKKRQFDNKKISI